MVRATYSRATTGQSTCLLQQNGYVATAWSPVFICQCTDVACGLEAQDFVKIFPEKFQNKTNGVTPRRWLAFCNPELAALITDTLGSDKWIKDLDQLQVLFRFCLLALTAITTATRGSPVVTRQQYVVQHTVSICLLTVLSRIWCCRF